MQEIDPSETFDVFTERKYIKPKNIGTSAKAIGSTNKVNDPI